MKTSDICFGWPFLAKMKLFSFLVEIKQDDCMPSKMLSVSRPEIYKNFIRDEVKAYKDIFTNIYRSISS